MKVAEAVERTVPMTNVRRHSTRSKPATTEATFPMEALYPYQETVFCICLGYAKNYTEAEDLTQEVYLKACQNLARLKDPSLARPWLFRIAKNSCLDHRKKVRTRRLLLRRAAQNLDVTSEPSSDEDFDRRIGLLKSAIQALPKKLLEALVLREYGRLSYEELASTLGLNKGTVMSRLSRARQRVAEALQEKTHERS